MVLVGKLWTTYCSKLTVPWILHNRSLSLLLISLWPYQKIRWCLYLLPVPCSISHYFSRLFSRLCQTCGLRLKTAFVQENFMSLSKLFGNNELLSLIYFFFLLLCVFFFEHSFNLWIMQYAQIAWLTFFVVNDIMDHILACLFVTVFLLHFSVLWTRFYPWWNKHSN